jgi:hypothetical protein
MVATLFGNDLTAVIRAMEESDQGPFVAAVVTLMRDINNEHVPDEDGDCEGAGCPNPYGEAPYNTTWPCSLWMFAQRIGVSWLMERAVRPDSGRTPTGILGESEGTPEDRAREQARERKRRQRERDGVTEEQRDTSVTVTSDVTPGTLNLT